RDGQATARRRLLEGPAHAFIFPNLFLGETNIAIVEPIDVAESVHWHTPMFLKGVPQFNGRLLRMAEAGMGPASFLMPEDLTVASRNQLRLEAPANRCVGLTRGLQRETAAAVGAAARASSTARDATPTPGLCSHFPSVMPASPSSPMVSDADYQAAAEFLYREARFAEGARYAEWHALGTDDGFYWVPATTDPGAS